MTTENDEKFRTMRECLADLLPRLNERDRRLALAAEAKSWGYGGISAVRRATGVSWKTIKRGMTELSGDPAETPSGRVRAPGGGRKKADVTDPELVDALESLIEPETRGDPRQAETDAGRRAGTTSTDAEQIRELRRENRELRRANEILKAASAFFARELDPRLPRS